MPTSVASSATRPTVWSSRMPSASSTSADPVDDDEARAPCLTTRSPVPAITIEAIVEMFTVWARSPPVPTMSTVRPGTSIRTACASIVSARAPNSSAVSPLLRSATRKPATRTGDASPVMISPIAQAACSGVRSVRATRAVSTSDQVGATLMPSAHAQR